MRCAITRVLPEPGPARMSSPPPVRLDGAPLRWIERFERRGHDGIHPGGRSGRPPEAARRVLMVPCPLPQAKPKRSSRLDLTGALNLVGTLVSLYAGGALARERPVGLSRRARAQR